MIDKNVSLSGVPFTRLEHQTPKDFSIQPPSWLAPAPFQLPRFSPTDLKSLSENVFDSNKCSKA